MKYYEVSYLISPEVLAEETTALASEILALIQKEGGLITKSGNPKPRTLSYQIKKQGAAFEVNVEFSLEPEKIAVIEDRIKKEPKVLRYLFVTKRAPIKEGDIKPRRVPKSMIGKLAESIFVKPTETPIVEEEKIPKRVDKKVELKDIEEKLEEILKEQS